jgi:RimJ/RimL family protein N-acetyltransferase
VGYRIDWTSDAGQLSAFEPTPDEVAQYAADLSRGYNDPRNAELMGHAEPIDADEVIELYADAAAEGTRSFLLFHAGAFAGDGDLRGLRGGTAEFAFMIGAPAAQGKGLGTKFATMIYAFAFEQLGLARVYASVIPANTASKRVFEKLGCIVDDSPAARAYADEPDDIVMAIDHATFTARNQPALTIRSRATVEPLTPAR